MAYLKVKIEVLQELLRDSNFGPKLDESEEEDEEPDFVVGTHFR